MDPILCKILLADQSLTTMDTRPLSEVPGTPFQDYWRETLSCEGVVWDDLHGKSTQVVLISSHR